MDWLEQSGSFSCARPACPQNAGETGDCSRCERPEPSKEIFQIITLWKRCKEWKILPDNGGLLDQDEVVMELLDVVSDTVNTAKKREHDFRQSEADQQEQLRKINGQRR